MDQRTTKDREGYVRVFYRNNGGYGDIAVRWHGDILKAWHSGAPFFAATDVWGDPLDIKLAEVCAIGIATLDGVARWKADDEIEASRRKSRELLSGD